MTPPMRSDDATTREVQRYAPEGHPCECGMQECDWGEYVKYEDVGSRIATLTAEVERLRAPVPCSVCGGAPLKSGRKCVCDGVGTEQAEMHGLRVECFRLQQDGERMREWLTKHARHTAYCNLSNRAPFTESRRAEYFAKGCTCGLTAALARQEKTK